MKPFITQAAAKRILKAQGITTTKIVSMAMAGKSAVLVVYNVKGKQGKCFATIKQGLFWTAFWDFRAEAGLKLAATEVAPGRYSVPSSSGSDYHVALLDDRVACSCKDAEWTGKWAKKRAVCKHGFSALGAAGFGSLQEMLSANAERATVSV